jgi:signal transduction histidine kinase
MEHKEPIVDVMASGVHDAKNVIFDARARIAAARRALLADDSTDVVRMLDQADFALDSAGRGLSVALAAYRLDQHENPVVLLPTVIPDLLQEVVLRSRRAGDDARLRIAVACAVPGMWLLDRELIAESLVNALQNAQRFARSTIVVSAERSGDELNLRIEDDGPGFRTVHHDTAARFSGIGLQVSHRIARLHERHGMHGRLEIFDGGCLGGAVFSLWLP